MEITAEMVRSLREQTGLPMMECKRALTEAAGQMPKAIDILRRAGSAKISKLAGRETTQGRIACWVNPSGQQAGIVELVCETAPVTSTDDFQTLSRMIAEAAAGLPQPTVEAVKAAPAPGRPGQTIDAVWLEVANRIRENMSIKRVASLTGHVAQYVHHNAQVGVVISLSADCPVELRVDLCMHIAALNPPYLRREDVDPSLVQIERERATAEAAGKPPQIVEKIVKGKLDRWYGEVVLLEQPFVKDDKHTVRQVLEAAAPGLTVSEFVRYHIGG
jgi:elongation factor Ts